MTRRVLLAGLLGAAVLIAWTIIVNVGFRFTARIGMEPIPNERAIYDLLREHVRQPGAYLANPEPTSTGEFPSGAPVFSIRYAGVGHEAAGRLLLIEFWIAVVSATLVAGLLSVTSARIQSRYICRVLYVATIGLLLAVSGDLAEYGIGGYPASDAVLLSANQFVSWVLAGLVMAWLVRDRRQEAATETSNRA
jgi:hypothetical protein